MGCPRCRSVAVTLSTRSTYRQPPSLEEPKLFLRQITAGRSIRSARLLVGSSPGVWANRHSAGSRLSSARHRPAVFFCPHAAPCSRADRMRARNGAIPSFNPRRLTSLFLKRCHSSNIWRQTASASSAMGSPAPPRSSAATKSLLRCAQHRPRLFEFGMS